MLRGSVLQVGAIGGKTNSDGGVNGARERRHFAPSAKVARKRRQGLARNNARRRVDHPTKTLDNMQTYSYRSSPP
jgi:hypothetical protein